MPAARGRAAGGGGRARLKGLRRRARRAGLVALAVILLLPPVLVALYRVVPPPVTPLMLIRAAGGAPIEKDWTPLAEIAPALVHAVIASEDSRFCSHAGFDWQAIRGALSTNAERGRIAFGGSTISQQLAKNLFLWPQRSWLRKGLEAGFTVLIEALWDKRRILEVYLNVVELGPGIYGAQAAARHHFGRSADELTRRQAALLAVTLPAPLSRDPAAPSAWHARRAGTIEQRMAVVRRDGLADCVVQG